MNQVKSVSQSNQVSQAKPSQVKFSQSSQPVKSVKPSQIQSSQSSQVKARHSTHPPVACLGRPLLTRNVSKGRRRLRRVSTAPPGGRLWHGFAVRRQPVGRGGGGLTFGLPMAVFGGDPRQTSLSFDSGGMDRNAAPNPAFFTERTVAAYLAVSDRTIRNWIRRGDLPSYKLGASRRIDPADVAAFLSCRREEAA